MAREILAIFKTEFVLSAFLRRASGGDLLGRCVAQNGGAKLLVGSLVSWHATRHGQKPS